MTDKAKRKILKFDFESQLKSGGKAHVALVDSACNLTEVLVMKAKDKQVTVSMEMKEFLKKFYGMWEEDAYTLATALGFETSDLYTNDHDYQNEPYEEYLKRKAGNIMIFKGVEPPNEMSETLYKSLDELKKEFEQVEKNQEETSSVNGEGKPTTEENYTMNEEQILKMQEEMKELKKQAALAETLKSQVAQLEKQAQEKREADTQEVLKGFGVFDETEVSEVAKFFVANHDAPATAVLLKALEKARVVAKDFATQEHGSDLTGTPEEELAKSNVSDLGNAVSEILKNRKKEQ